VTYPGQQPAAPERPTLKAPVAGNSIPLNPRNLMGRACIFIVHSVDLNAVHLGKRRPSSISDIYVIDGEGPIIYGDRQGDSPNPPTHKVEVPAFFSSVLMSGTWVDHIAPYVGTNQPVAGRWRLGDRVTNGNRAIMFVKLGGDLDPRAAEGAAVGDRLIDLLVAHRAGQWTPPEPVSLIAPAPTSGAPGIPQHPQVHYGPPSATPSLPQAPTLPKPPALPTAAPEGWLPGLATLGWTPDQWAQHYPSMSQADRDQWAAAALQPTH